MAITLGKAGHICIQTRTQDYSGQEKLMEVRVDVLKQGTDHIVTIMVDNAVEGLY